MNVNPDSPNLPGAEGSAPEAADVVAKPARRPRTPKVVVDAAAAVDATAHAAPDDGAARAEEPPPKPKRRRAVPVEAAGDTATSEPRSEAAGEAPVSADVQPALAPREAVRAEGDDEGRRDEQGEAAGEAQREAQAEGSSEEQAEPQGQTPGEGQRSRRRNRRDRKRGERGETGADQSNRPVVAVDPAAVAAAAAQQASEVFAHVVSGDFDVEGAGEEEPADEADAAAPKRVLAPEPEAPKLHKVLAQAGIGSRRDMEELILDGRITVNDEPAHIGQRISFGDQVKVSGKPVKLRIMPLPARIIAYHKPVGEIVTHDDPQNRPTVFRRLPRLQQGKWQSVGRLDINTEGLLLFTTSGELANQLMHPRFGVEREYAVRVLGTLTPEAKAELIEGVMVEGQKCGFRSIEDGGGEGANHWYRVVITEGRNREVRKLFDVVGLTVSRLIRIRYGNVVLPHGLKRGAWVDLEDADVRAIRRLASGNNQGQQRDGPRDGQQGGRGNNERQGGPQQQKQRNDRQGGRPNDRGRGNNNSPQGRFTEPQPNAAPQGNEPDRDFEHDPDSDIDFDPRSIPNPLEQTFDKRFVQNPRSPAGGRGFGRGGGGFGAGGSAPPAQKKGPGPAQPDPLQTSLGFIGADAFHRKGNRGGGGGGGGRGGNRGGGGGGGGGGFGGGGGGYGGGGGGGGRRGR